MHACFRYAKLFCHFSAACFTILHECEWNSLDVFVGSDGRWSPTSLLIVHIFSPTGEAVIPVKHAGVWHHVHLVGCLQQLVCFCRQTTGWKTKFKRISLLEICTHFLFTWNYDNANKSLLIRKAITRRTVGRWIPNLARVQLKVIRSSTQIFIEIAPLVPFLQRLSYYFRDTLCMAQSKMEQKKKTKKCDIQTILQDFQE